MTDFPEAPAVAYTNLKTPSGYQWSFTMRSATVKDLVAQIENMEPIFKAKGWEAQDLRSSFGKKKEVKLVEGRRCPKCGAGIVEKRKADGHIFYKCEKGGYNPTTKQSTGCDYVDWNNPPSVGQPVEATKEFYGEPW